MKKKFSLVFSLLGVATLTACGPTTSETTTSEPEVGTSEPTTAPTTAPTPLEPGQVDSTGTVVTYAAESYDERAKAAGALEEFGMKNHLTGIPLNTNGGSVMYNSRLEIPSNVYIPNYGFGIGRGKIKTAMTNEQESVKAYQSYYHAYQTSDPGTINYLDSQDSVTGDLYDMVSLSYYGMRLNASKDSYEWYNQLASEKPIAMNADVNGMATKWKVKLNITDKLVYNTNSAVPAVAAFNGTKVKLDDFLTPFKLMLNNLWFRSTDLGSTESGFVGVKQYIKDIQAERTPSWDNVGIQLNSEDNSIEFEFNTKKTAFYAMYNLASSLFSPISSEFITAIGGAANYGKKGIDSVLSTGVYTLEKWEDQVQLVFKKNPTSIVANEYFMDGYLYKIIGTPALAFKEFTAGKLDACSIPTAELSKYKSDPRTRKTLGDTVWALQVNATDQERYDELFGETGSIYPHKTEDKWELKPVMSNSDFLDAVYYSINRAEYADSIGSTPAMSYLSEAYMIDPEQGIAYRDSEPGKAVEASRQPETSGYSAAISEALFARAMASLETAGKYTPGTAANKTKISLKMNFQDDNQVKDIGAKLAQYIETSFNKACPLYQLEIEPIATTNWMDAYYVAMHGEFDFSWGAISGNTLDPLSFFNVLSDTNSTGFTLSWGAKTGVISKDISYDGKTWAFDTLYSAFTTGAYLVDGVVSPVIANEEVIIKDLGSNAYQFSVVVNTVTGNAVASVTIDSVVLYDLATGEQTDVDLSSALEQVKAGSYKISGQYTNEYGAGATAIIVYYLLTLDGITTLQELDIYVG